MSDNKDRAMPAAQARATSPDGPQPASQSSRSGVPIAVEASLPFIFEPHGAFRSGLADEDWPFGYISGWSAGGPVEPIFGLHEVIGERPVEELAAFAAFIVRACNSHYELLEALEKIAEGLFSAEKHGCDLLLGLDRVEEYASAARAAIAKARGDQP